MYVAAKLRRSLRNAWAMLSSEYLEQDCRKSRDQRMTRTAMSTKRKGSSLGLAEEEAL
jgi:hypothetical protein